MRSGAWPSSSTVRPWVLAGALLAACPAGAGAQRTSYEELQTFSAIINRIRTSYVDSVGQAALVRAAIAGALVALDPHSVYLRAGTLDRLAAAEAGLAGSVGARLEHNGSDVVVLSAGTGSPAQRGGARPGDRVLAVNDTPTAGLSADEVEALLAGDAGTKVRLAISRGPPARAARLTLELKRAVYRWPAVPVALRLDSLTGLVRLEQFSTGSAGELERVVRDLRRDGARRIVIDLRGNPGGLVGEATRIAGLFLEKGAVIARIEQRRGAEEVLRGEGGGLRDLPLIVLVDEASASASELLAAALQDHDRARVLGRRTFGKALVQTPFPLTGGDALMLTTGRIRSPVGRSLQREYRGLTRAQYYALAGDSASRPRTLLRSLGGRALDGGPGVAPDVPLPEPPSLPAWWPAATDAGIDIAIADSAAAALVGTESDWSEGAGWDALADSLLLRVRPLLGTDPALTPTERTAIARTLAARAARVKWGDAAAARLLARTDTDIAAALGHFH